MLYTSACFSIIAEGILNCSVSLNLAQTYLELSSLIGTVVYLTGWAKDDNGDGNGTHPPDTVYFTFLKRQTELFLVMACSLIISHNL